MSTDLSDLNSGDAETSSFGANILAAVGAAGIPMAGLVMLVVVLQAVGLPLEGIGTIIAVDRVLDMMRTATNVWSDLVGTAVVNRFEGDAS